MFYFQDTKAAKPCIQTMVFSFCAFAKEDFSLQLRDMVASFLLQGSWLEQGF